MYMWKHYLRNWKINISQYTYIRNNTPQQKIILGSLRGMIDWT